MFKYLDSLDKKKSKENTLAIFPGFNILEKTNTQTKEQNSNSYAQDKGIISENMFSKLYGLIDNVKQQLTKKYHKKAQKKLTRKHLTIKAKK